VQDVTGETQEDNDPAPSQRLAEKAEPAPPIFFMKGLGRSHKAPEILSSLKQEYPGQNQQTINEIQGINEDGVK
jgi:hypothetical protein